MEKIIYYPSIFTAEELNAMAQQIIKGIETSGNTDEKLLTATDLLKTSNERLTGILKSLKSNPFTSPLNNSDKWRDHIFFGGKTVIQGMSHYVFDENIKQAAERLEAIIRRHGWSMQDYTYQDQTSATNSLIKELKNAENQADLTTIGQMPWFDALVKAQADFEEVYNDKANYESIKESTEKKKAALPVSNDIENLVLYLNTTMLFTDENMKPVFNQINGIIMEATKRSRLRRSGSSTDENNEETDN